MAERSCWLGFTAGSAAISPRFPSYVMARWPRQTWTSILTYAIVFVLFPLLCYLAWAWVNGLIF